MKKVLFFFVLVGVIVGGLYLVNNSPTAVDTDIGKVVPIQPVDPKVTPKVDPPPKPVEPNVIDVLKPVFRTAQASDKKVLVFVSMNPCVWCDKMRRDVMPNLTLTFYVYLETKDASVWRAYNIDSFPTFILFDKTGKELKRRAGYCSVQVFQNWLVKAQQHCWALFI